MLGAIIGDTIGSVYEFHNIKTTKFPLFSKCSNYTDDSVLTVAIAHWLLSDPDHSHSTLEKILEKYVRENHTPMGGYGSGFLKWIMCMSTRAAYNSYGNGSAMRVSPVGWAFPTLKETEHVAEISASITHNHPEGIKGACATAAAIFMARTGKSKQEIKNYISYTYGYNLNRTCDEIRPFYNFDESCQGTVPEAIIAFLESENYENCIRLGISLGGDSDTLCTIAGSIAEAFYKEIPTAIANHVWELLPKEFRNVIVKFSQYSTYGYVMEHSLKQLFSPIAESFPSRYTPDNITHLAPNEIFVFGSNRAGCHGGGAAYIALKNFGAVMGQGVGLQGQSYAIPTMQGGIETIRPYVNQFIDFARQHRELTFLVTRIGCGIAGFKDSEIAPLFAAAKKESNIILPLTFYQ